MCLKKYLYFSLILMLIGAVFFGYIFSFYGNFGVFKYPEERINFAGEQIDSSDERYIEKFNIFFRPNIKNIYSLYKYNKNYNIYIPNIEMQLEKVGIPNDFKYLAIAESGLDMFAISNVGAAGLWQFMPETARRYGLIVDSNIDERFDVKKSTRAATMYLNDLYVIFGNWTLVAAAYNRGENGLLKDMKNQSSSSYYELELNKETGDYLFRILRIKYMLKNYFSLF